MTRYLIRTLEIYLYWEKTIIGPNCCSFGPCVPFLLKKLFRSALLKFTYDEKVILTYLISFLAFPMQL